MNRLNKIFLTGIILIFTTVISSGQRGKLNTGLVHTIDSLFKADQDCATIKPADSAAAKYQRVIRSNFPLIKSILDKYGYPGYDIVGKEGSGNYFLLVQHSDFNVGFQKRVLKLMKKQVVKKNASGSSYAFLVDRVELNSGQLQVYGTQVLMGRSGTKLRPCIDTLNLDKRRKTVGLMPIKEYLQKCDEAFKEMNPTEIKKKE
ncbi:MAG TPA: DUF6624 domain-containing protein [Bacteroidia bacterium]|jgi:hypothetical protein|nr:DUF6624 domain-containing protein [Bacteroidia bacterium]